MTKTASSIFVRNREPVTLLMLIGQIVHYPLVEMCQRPARVSLGMSLSLRDREQSPHFPRLFLIIPSIQSPQFIRGKSSKWEFSIRQRSIIKWIRNGQ